MKSGETLDSSTSEFTGPYHGSQEMNALMFFVLTLLEGAVALAFPWLDLHFVAHRISVGPHLWMALSTNLLCLVALFTFLRIYRDLSRRIARGGEPAAQLDKVRLSTASLASTLVFAGLMLHMCGAWLTR